MSSKTPVQSHESLSVTDWFESADAFNGPAAASDVSSEFARPHAHVFQQTHEGPHGASPRSGAAGRVLYHPDLVHHLQPIPCRLRCRAGRRRATVSAPRQSPRSTQHTATRPYSHKHRHRRTQQAAGGRRQTKVAHAIPVCTAIARGDIAAQSELLGFWHPRAGGGGAAGDQGVGDEDSGWLLGLLAVALVGGAGWWCYKVKRPATHHESR